MSAPHPSALRELARRYRLEAEYPTALAFEQRLDPRLRSTPALELLSGRLTAALRSGSRARLILSVPPQEGKTTLTRAAILRELAIHPEQRVVVASYGMELSRDSSRTIRDDMVQHADWLGVQPQRGRAAVTSWSVAGYRGGVQAAAPGAALVGKPADVVVIDDPFSGAAEADSKDRRDAVWKWWTGTVANRLSSGAPVVLIMCLTGDTPVLMGDGTTKPLGDIRPGDPVATYGHGGCLTTATVRNWASQGTDRVYSVVTESGRVVRANARHPFRTIDTEGNEAWTRVSALQPGNRVVSVELAGAPGGLSNTYGRGVDTVASVEPTGYAEVFDIEVEGTHNFIANGLEVSNTRWHHDDLAGRLLRYSAQPWEALNIPAQCVNSATDPLGRRVGEFLLSARGRDLQDWETRKAEAGPRVWSALFQGSPTPDTGGVFQRSWWQTWRQLPLTVDKHGRQWLTGFDTVIQSWDLTFGATENADFVVGQVWGTRGTDTFLLDQVRDRMSFPEQTQAVAALRAKWPQTSAVLIEAKANGAAVISTLASRIPGIVPITPTESKRVRAEAVSPFVAAKNVYIPDPESGETAWAAGLLEELATFPQGEHDDQVDAASQALRWIYQPALRKRAQQEAASQLRGADHMYDLG